MTTRNWTQGSVTSNKSSSYPPQIILLNVPWRWFIHVTLTVAKILSVLGIAWLAFTLCIRLSAFMIKSGRIYFRSYYNLMKFLFDHFSSVQLQAFIRTGAGKRPVAGDP